MATYRFFESVIMSCKNHEQLQSCIQWVDGLRLKGYMRPAITDLIRAKAKELTYKS